MKKLMFLLFIPLLFLTALPAKNTGSERRAPAANQELAALAANAAIMDAAGSLQLRQRPFSREKTVHYPFLGERWIGSQSDVSLFQILGPAGTIPVEITDGSGTPISEYEIGDSIAIIITYADSVWIRPYVDNGNGIFDPQTDFYFSPKDPDEDDEEIIVVDGDEEDEDPTTGVWKITFDTGKAEEGDILFSLQGVKVFFSLSNRGETDTGLDTLDMLPMVSTTSLSGNVTKFDETPAPNVVMIAFPEQMMKEDDSPENLFITVTDAEGDYTLFIEDAVAGVDFGLFAMDLLEQYTGLFPEPQWVMIPVATGDSLINNDFVLEEPTAVIRGTLTDDSASPVPIAGVRIFAGMDGPFEAEDTTDTDGEYSIPVVSGWWRVRPEEDDLIELGYMAPLGEEEGFDISDEDTIEVNFVAYEADATISGTVTLDGTALPDFEVGAWGEPVGYAFTESETDGSYTLQVSSKVDARGYDIWPEDMPDQTYFADQLWGIQPGATDVDINLVTVTGGITGVVTDEASGDTLYEDIGIMVRDATGAEFNTWIDWETGQYLIYLPDGIYELMVFSHDYPPYQSEPIIVSGSVVTHNVVLTRLDFDAKIGGTLTDDEAIPIAGIRIYAGAEGMFGMDDTTDAAGKYGFPAFAGWWHVNPSDEDLIDRGYLIPHGSGFEVTTGDCTAVDFVTYAADATIAGTITWDDGGSAVEYVEIHGDTPAGYYSRTRTGSDGTYALPVSSKLDSIEIGEGEGTWKTQGYCINPWYKDALAQPGGSCEVYSGATGIDFTMYPADVFLSGHISDQYGNPVPDANMHAFTFEGALQFHTGSNTEFDGLYEMPLIDGYSWALEIYLPYIQDGPAKTDTLFDADLVSGSSLVRDYNFTVQYPPDAFALSLPTDSTILIITDATLSDSLTISWRAAVFEGTVRYDLLFLGDLAILPAFSQETDTLVKLPHQEIVDSLLAHGETSAITGQWEIIAVADNDTTWLSVNGPFTLTIDASTLAVPHRDLLPAQFTLHQNYPNPFNPTTTLRFDLPEASEVYLVIYDLLGRQLVQLADGRREAGYHRIVWNGRDDRGRTLPTGLYIARIVTPEFTRSIKLVLLK